jgi:hypothetical protein
MKPVEKDVNPDPVAEANEALRRSRKVANENEESKAKMERDASKTLPNQFKNAMEGISAIAESVKTAKSGIGWIHKNVVKPVADIPYIGAIVTSPFRYTYAAYYNFTHPYKDETLWQATKGSVNGFFGKRWNSLGNLFREEKVEYPPDLRVRGPINSRRAGAAALMTAWALAGMLNLPVAGDSFNYVVKEPIIDGARMATTIVFNGVSGKGFELTRDTLYFGVPTKESGDDIYHVNGSTSPHSNEDNSLSFEVRDRLVHEIWSWAHGHGPFRPDYVVGPIRPDSNKCETVSYGSRFRLARWASYRPDILSVSCQAAEASPTAH